jgi:hypothetical protein
LGKLYHRFAKNGLKGDTLRFKVTLLKFLTKKQSNFEKKQASKFTSTKKAATKKPVANWFTQAFMNAQQNEQSKAKVGKQNKAAAVESGWGRLGVEMHKHALSKLAKKLAARHGGRQPQRKVVRSFKAKPAHRKISQQAKNRAMSDIAAFKKSHPFVSRRARNRNRPSHSFTKAGFTTKKNKPGKRGAH